MPRETWPDSHIEWSKQGKKWKIRKNILKSLLAALIAGWVITWWVSYRDIKKASNKKESDKKTYWIVKAKPDKKVTVFSPDFSWWPDSLDIPLDTIMEHNRDIINIDATKLQSIMIWEESLKTTNGWFVSEFDEWLEMHWIDRNPYSASLIGKTLGKFKEWSYWPYQVQPEAIDKYKNNPDLYDTLCKKIAKLKLPNAKWELIPLHEQLSLTVEEMVKQIKNHEIYTFVWGERFLIAYWIVLIDQISRETDAMLDSYDWEKWYNTWVDNTSNAEKQHSELVGDDNKIMSPYFLKDKWAPITYSWIWNLFNNDAFKNGMVSAYWCMDYIKNIENSDYLFTLSLLELNERFKNWGKWDLDVVVPTWKFWPTTLKLVNKHFKKDFEDVNDAKKFMDDLSEEELQKIRQKALNTFETNMRLLYTLNLEDNHWINEKQSKYLSECLDLTFNHMYSSVIILSEFINNKWWKNSNTVNKKLFKYRNDYVKEQNKDSLEEIKKIMTDEATFISFTWLKRNSYLEWIKHYLWPTLLGASDWIYQTKWIIPVIQKNPWWTKTSNEQNSIFRFSMWVSQEEIAQADRERWIEYKLQRWDTNVDSLKNIMWSKKPVKEYLQKCKTIYWDSITSPQDIPDELVIEMLRGIDNFYPLFEGEKWFYEWDTIYIKYIWLDKIYHVVEVNQPATKQIEKKIRERVTSREPVAQKKWNKKWKKKGKNEATTKKVTKFVDKIVKENIDLCWINPNGTLTINKWWTFQEILYIYSQNDPTIKKILETIAWKPIAQQSDIDQKIIKEIIRHPDWTTWRNINSVSVWDEFIIVIPLNY